MDGIARLDARERAEFFNEAGARRGLASAIIEKDFWVCWAMKRLFTMEGDNPSLVFKGGTSLSKVFGVIQRFSEDVDLSFDREDFGFGDDRDPVTAPSKKKREKLIKELRESVQDHIVTVFVPVLTEEFAAVLGATAGEWDLSVGADREAVIFRYPSSLASADYDDLDYIKPVVRLELGARGDTSPSERYSIRPYAADEFPDLFEDPGCEVVALAPERSFWEKATILHRLHHRPADQAKSEAQSRHYSDLAKLADSKYGISALEQLDLLERVSTHAAMFFPYSWASYETAKPGSLRLVPREDRMSALKTDYEKMRPMFFVEPPAFADVIARLAELEGRINASA